MRIRTTRIDWDTDGENADLPQIVTLVIKDEDMESPTAVAAALSDTLGWCVNNLDYVALADLLLEVEYDPDQTDPESLCSTADSLLETAQGLISLGEYGSPTFGKFLLPSVEGQLRKLLMQVEDNEGCSAQSALRDILTELRHLAAERKVDFDAALVGSHEVFQEELDEKRPES